jgi:crotonobetainyl-CoA:carnitine CoA-transferase CaiB-like acyl-CoA transferase
MGRRDLLKDPRFIDVPSRLANLREFNGILAEWARSVPDADEIERIFEKHNLATGRLRSVADISRTDWAEHRGAITEVSDRAGGSVRIPQSPWKFSDADVRITGVPKYRGEDNAKVLRELLGFDDASIERLERDGVTSSHGPTKQ